MPHHKNACELSNYMYYEPQLQQNIIIPLITDNKYYLADREKNTQRLYNGDNK